MGSSEGPFLTAVIARLGDPAQEPCLRRAFGHLAAERLARVADRALDQLELLAALGMQQRAVDDAQMFDEQTTHGTTGP